MDKSASTLGVGIEPYDIEIDGSMSGTTQMTCKPLYYVPTSILREIHNKCVEMYFQDNFNIN